MCAHMCDTFKSACFAILLDIVVCSFWINNATDSRIENRIWKKFNDDAIKTFDEIIIVLWYTLPGIIKAMLTSLCTASKETYPWK